MDVDRSGMDFAERLSLWFGPLAAIRLQAVHQSIRAVPGAGRQGRGSPAGAIRSLEQDVQRVRGLLSRAIAQDPLALAGLDARDPQAGYAPFRQRHVELQRQMEQMVGALRDHVRQVVGRHSIRLQPLVALDAVLEEVLAPREQKLLPAVAASLERRFAQLRRTHREAPDGDAASAGRGEWLDTFGQEWRQVLLAELDLRLQPVAGLVEALRNEHEQQA